MNTETYSIPSWKLDELLHQIEKLNRKTAKLGCPSVTVRELGRTIEDHPYKEAVKVEWVEIEVSGEAPKFAGWEFVASIDQTDAGNLIRSTPGAGELPSWVRTTECKCDHCHTNRFRRETFILRHDNGDYKQVGRQCLRDFLGHQNPHDLARWASALSSISEACQAAEDDIEGSYGSGGDSMYDVVGVMALAAAVIQDKGYIKANESESTRDTVLDIIQPPKNLKREVREQLNAYRETSKTEATKELVEASLAWAASLEGESDFDHNMRTIAKLEAINWRHFGLTCYVVAGYLRHLGILEARRVEAASKLNEVVGTPKERLKGLKLRVCRVVSTEGQFGPSSFHIMEDEAGRCFTWRTGSFYMQGQTLVLDGTVKEHSEFNGRKQTVLTRCKVQ